MRTATTAAGGPAARFPDNLHVEPSRGIRGTIAVPGDKSITHRAYLLGALARGVTRVVNPNPGLDCAATLRAVELLGAHVGAAGEGEAEGNMAETRIEGVGGAIGEPAEVIDCGNSGTTMRLLCGILSGGAGIGILTGDASLCSRPMDRVMEPLERMGARIYSRSGGRAPLVVRPGPLRGIRYELPVASSQVKSSILLAGLAAKGATVVHERIPTRDHTERMLKLFSVAVEIEASRGESGAKRHPAETPTESKPTESKSSESNPAVSKPRASKPRESKARQSKAAENKSGADKSQAGGTEIRIEGGGSPLVATDIHVPADLSSAIFFLVAALILPESEVVIEGVGMNPTRRGAIDALIEMGGEIELRGLTDDGFEPVATVVARSSRLSGVEIGGDRIPSLIDELPILAVAGAFANGSTVVRGAAELRAKESDRIEGICRCLTAAGVRVEEREDGFVVHGGPRPHEAVVDALGDHRIAMAMAVLGLGATAPLEIRGTGGIPTSFPGFADELLGARAQR